MTEIEKLESCIESLKKDLQSGYHGDCMSTEDREMAISALEKLREYRKVGTLKECQEAMEKQRAEKVLEATKYQEKAGYKHRCPNCKCAVGYVEKKPFRKRVLIESAASYCCICGKAIDWR